MTQLSRRRFLNHSALAAAATVLPTGSLAAAAQDFPQECALWNRLGWAPGCLAALREAVGKNLIGPVAHVQLEAEFSGNIEEVFEAGVAAALFLAPDLTPTVSWRYGVEEEGPYQMLIAETATHERVVVKVNAPGTRLPVSIGGSEGSLTLQGMGAMELCDSTGKAVREITASPFPRISMNTLVAAAHDTVAQAGRTAKQRMKQG